MALNDPRNSVGHILPDGRIKLDSNKIAPWLRGLKGMDYQVLGCPLHGLPSAKKMVGRAGSSPKEIAALEDS